VFVLSLRRPGRSALVACAAVGLTLAPVAALAGQQSPSPSGRAVPVVAVPGGPWVPPLGGPVRVGRRFAPPASRYARGHRGVDLVGVPGTPVRAAGPGVVVYAGVLAGRGVVSVEHGGGLRTTYEPLDPITVVRGQHVPTGALLGRIGVGHPGCTAAGCLHWGLRRGRDYLDPLILLGRGPMRLLPLDGSRGR